ncbi:amidohydrolase [Mycena galericulata]|nr:amidohydrolase [Mycena galericulata]
MSKSPLSQPYSDDSSGLKNPPDVTRLPPLKPISTSVALLGVSLVVSLLALYFGLPSKSLVSPSFAHTGQYVLCSRHGNIYTVDSLNSRVDCIVVNNSQIAYAGNLAGTRRRFDLPIHYVPKNAIVLAFELAHPKRVVPIWTDSVDIAVEWLSLPLPAAVEGGVILTDDAGVPTGVLLDNAQELLKTPPLTQSDLLQRFTVAFSDALAYGLTSVHDAGLDPASLAFFVRQAETGHIPIRIYGMRFFDENEPYWGNTSEAFVGAADGRLTSRSVKIFADGALRTGGSALYEPYTDNPSTNGFMRLPTEVLFEFIPRFLRDGWQVNVHAIGDRSNGIVLDAFEASLKGVNVTALRPRLEHAQLMTKADMERLGKLGVIASVQPTHAISDMWFAQDRLGPERVKGLYAFRSLIDSGARITLGSDFPVESMNPLAGLYAATTRVSFQGDSPHGPGGWFPEERLTRGEALRGTNDDRPGGSLEVGKRADFVVLSRDIMKIPAPQILETKVLATVLDGKVAYGSL